MKSLFFVFVFSTILFVSCGSDEGESKSSKPVTEFRFHVELGVSPIDGQTISKSDYDYAEEVLTRRFENARIDEFAIKSDPDNNKIIVGLDQNPDDAWLHKLISANRPVGFYLGYDMSEIMTPFIEKMVNPYVWKFHESIIGDDTLFVDTSAVYSKLYQKYFPILSEASFEEMKVSSVLFRFKPRDYSLILNAILDPVFKEAKEEFPDFKFAFDLSSLKVNADFMRCYALKVPFDEEDIITDKNIQSAKYMVDPNSGSKFVILKLDTDGADNFGKITSENVGKVLFVVVGEEVITAPLIQSAITGGEVQISGNFTSEQAKNLESMFNTGAFPFRVSIDEVRENK